MRTSTAHRLAVPAVVAFLALVGGCGGGPDAEALSESFGKRAQDAYATEGRDRDEDFNNGIQADCFIIGMDGAAEVGEAVTGDRGDYVPGDKSYLRGAPGEDETMSCAILESEDDDSSVVASVSAGTTLVDAEGLLARQLRGDGASEIEADVSGLDEDDVVAIVTEGSSIFTWVDDGFVVSISGPSEELDPDDGGEVLEVAVDAVAAELGS